MGEGKVDVGAMLEGMRARLERDEAEGRLAGLTVDRLAEAVSHPEAAERIAEFLEIEARSVGVGDPAPDFTLPWLPGAEGRGPALRLSAHFPPDLPAARPVALIFGSYT